MYKYLSVLAILLLFTIGCTDESNMISPVENTINNNEVINNPNFIALLPGNTQRLKKISLLVKLFMVIRNHY